MNVASPLSYSSFIQIFPGDASYCTPEQYKDCAEPALGKSAHAHNLMDARQGDSYLFCFAVVVFPYWDLAHALILNL